MLKARQTLGKYRIERRLADGGFATVYRALDTIEGIRVAVKIPHAHLVSKEVLDDFRKEVRLAAKLDHANILPLKNAAFIDGNFVIVFPLGERTLDERLRNRMSLRTVLEFAEQMLEAVAYAHRQRIIHCDVKPENLILFPGNRLRLTDFGIAKVAQRTVRASGSGTMGYIAPEQAMGKPSFRSDVFSVGLVLYRMLSGRLPEWPYDWPPPGFEKVRRRLSPGLLDLVLRAIEVDPRKRFHDADQMLAAFRRIKTRAINYANGQRRSRRKRTTKHDWQAVRWRQFQRQYRRALETHYACHRCRGPVSEPMHACPWCGTARKVHDGETRFPASCPRCKRGMKLDWTYCPWCFGPGFQPHSHRHYTDVRYEAQCVNRRCPRRLLMPYMRYCPWCRRKARHKWKVPGSHQHCPQCGWGVVTAFWDYCPWCSKLLAPVRAAAHRHPGAKR